MAVVGTAIDSTGEGDLTLLIFYATLALGVSFLCSILEAVVLSIPHTQIAMWEKDGKGTGAVLSLIHISEPTRPY